MRMIIFVALLFVIACTPSEPESEPVQDVSEPSMQSGVDDVAETVVEESPDAYSDLQTEDDTFDAMDDALNALG